MMPAEGPSGPVSELDTITAQFVELGAWRAAVQCAAQAGTAWLSSKRVDLFDQRFQEAFALASEHGLIYLELITRLQKLKLQLTCVGAGGIFDSIAAEARDKGSELAKRIQQATGDAISTCDAIGVLLDQPDYGGTALLPAVDAAAQAAAEFELSETQGLISDWRSEEKAPPFTPAAMSELHDLTARLRTDLEQRRASLSTQADLIRAALKSAFGDCDSPIEILTRALEKAANLPSLLVQVYMALADAYCARAAILNTNSSQAAADDLDRAERAAANAAAIAKHLANEQEKLAPIAKLNEVRALRSPERSSGPTTSSGFYGAMAVLQDARRALNEGRPSDALTLLDTISKDQIPGASAGLVNSMTLGLRAAANYDLDRYKEALPDLDSRIAELEQQSNADSGEFSYSLDHRLEELQNLCLVKAGALAKLDRFAEAWNASERGRAASPGNGTSAAPQTPPVEWEIWRAWLRSQRAAFLSFSLNHWGALIFSAAPDDDQPSATVLSPFPVADTAKLLQSGAAEDSQVWTGVIFGAVADLSAKLIHPIQPLLERLAARAEVLYILPDSYLFRVPFPALTFADGRYLDDLCPLTVAPSAAFVLVNSARTHEPARSCLAVGVGQAPKDKPVVHFAQQATAIAGLWAAPRTCATLLDDDATAATLRQMVGSADVLHLACHGSTSSEVHDPMGASRLELADGNLTASEVLTWSLPANLVFMNVCQGGRFRIEGRSNVNGFIRAFHASGACSVISSVTHIDPLPASELAVRFYRHWFTGVSKARALQLARQEVRQLYPAAKDWASHTLVGDYR